MRAIEILKREDYLGILTFSDSPVWEIPIRRTSDGLELRQALDVISKVSAQGGTNMFMAMEDVLSVVETLPSGAPESRHILVFTDGQSHDGSLETFSELARRADSQGMTISTIALGNSSDKDLLQTIAEISHGRFHPVSQPDELPDVMVLESQAAHSENIQKGEITVKLGKPDHPVLFGMMECQLPTLHGYNALTSIDR